MPTSDFLERIHVRRLEEYTFVDSGQCLLENSLE